MLYKPKDVELHDYIIGKMDFAKVAQGLRFELLCLLAMGKGTKHPSFLSLFTENPWLCGR